MLSVKGFWAVRSMLRNRCLGPQLAMLRVFESGYAAWGYLCECPKSPIRAADRVWDAKVH